MIEAVIIITVNEKIIDLKSMINIKFIFDLIVFSIFHSMIIFKFIDINKIFKKIKIALVT